MKLTIAKTAGFCMGVKRAVELAIDHSGSNKNKLYTLGPLIHNQQTIDMLKDHGVETLNENDTSKKESRIIIRAHGIPPHELKKISQNNNEIIDGTCPKVTAVHKVIQKYRDQGFCIVITGDKGHAEVIGLLGYAGDQGHLIQKTDDVSLLPKSQKYCLVSQTTFNGITFDNIAKTLKNQHPKSKIVIKKTICSATDKRQLETRELAKQVNAMIVVGGKHSANTLRLAAIAKENCNQVQLVETEQEINWDILSELDHIGITAGASTPNWMIKRVIDHLYTLDHARKHSIKNIFFRSLDILAHLNFFVALGAAIMCYTSSLLQGLAFNPTSCLLVFLYFLSMHLFNSLASMDATKHLGINRYRFYQAHKKIILGFTLFCMATLLILSLSFNHTIFSLLFIATLAGVFYHFSILPKTLQKRVKYKNLKDIPTSRDLFTALAWAVLVTFIPQAALEIFSFSITTIAFFVALFFMAYFRTLIFDLKDIEGDRIFGRETLVSIIGEKKTIKWMFYGLWFAFFSLLIFTILSLIPGTVFSKTSPFVFLLQIPVLFYIGTFMKFSHKLKASQYALFYILADTQFFIAGLGAWLAKLML